MKRALELVNQWDSNQPFTYEATVDIAEAMAREIVKISNEQKSEILSINHQADTAKLNVVYAALDSLGIEYKK